MSKIQKETAVKGLNNLFRPYASALGAWRNMTPGRMRGYVRAALLDLGWLGVVGIGMLAMCLAFYFSALRPAEQKLRVLRDTVLQLGKPGGKQTNIVEGVAAPEEQLAIFYASFPSRISVPGSLEKIYAAATIEGLTLEQVDYKASQPGVGRLTRYQLNLPLKGEYSRINKFLVRVLRDVPSASLEKVLFERKKIDDPVVDATVTLVLHLGPEL